MRLQRRKKQQGVIGGKVEVRGGRWMPEEGAVGKNVGGWHWGVCFGHMVPKGPPKNLYASGSWEPNSIAQSGNTDRGLLNIKTHAVKLATLTTNFSFSLPTFSVATVHRPSYTSILLRASIDLQLLPQSGHETLNSFSHDTPMKL